MGRPSQRDEKRGELLPIITEAFSELGYHRATTAELAARCGVQENVLYRLWADKPEMFAAAIDHLRQTRLDAWSALGGSGQLRRDAAQRMLSEEAKQVGELQLHRVIFAALAETDDPKIRLAARRMYGEYQTFLARAISAHRGAVESSLPSADVSAWAAIGLVTMVNITNELDLVSRRERKRLFSEIAGYLLDGEPRWPPSQDG
jgi:AcrR family transcriptional regulator